MNIITMNNEIRNLYKCLKIDHTLYMQIITYNNKEIYRVISNVSGNDEIYYLGNNETYAVKIYNNIKRRYF